MWTIHCVANYGGTCGLEGQRIRIPAIARPAGGSDHHLGVIDQSNGSVPHYAYTVQVTRTVTYTHIRVAHSPQHGV